MIKKLSLLSGTKKQKGAKREQGENYKTCRSQVKKAGEREVMEHKGIRETENQKRGKTLHGLQASENENKSAGCSPPHHK